MEPTSEQELKQLLDEGKITEDEYKELLEAIHKQPQPEIDINNAETEFPFEPIPWQIWVIVVILGLEGILNFLMILSNPTAIIWLLTKIIFIVGLLKGWRWVFIIFEIIAAMHVIYFGAEGAMFISFVNLVLMALAFTAIRYFFPTKQTA